MKSYIYELIVFHKEYSEEYGQIGTKIKRFLGNDKNELMERFEMWFIKQRYDRSDIDIYIGEIQHAGYRAK